MADPKDFMDDRHTYVRGYVRRNRRGLGGGGGLLGCLLLVAIGIGVLVAIIRFMWPIVLLLVIVGSGIYILTHWKSWERRRRARKLERLEKEEQAKEEDRQVRRRLEELKK